MLATAWDCGNRRHSFEGKCDCRRGVVVLEISSTAGQTIPSSASLGSLQGALVGFPLAVRSGDSLTRKQLAPHST